jgi:hypothetical protein
MLVWIWHNGVIPAGYEVDHRDRGTLNDRIENLRLATRSQNCINRRIHSNNTTGYKGVYWHKRDAVWYVRVSVENVGRHLGNFDTFEDAVACRDKWVAEHHGEFACEQL